MIFVWLFFVAVVAMTAILAAENTAKESVPSLLYSEVVPPEQRKN